MKSGKLLALAALFLLHRPAVLTAQAPDNPPPANTAPDPLLVSAELSRQLEGTQNPQDKTLSLEECLARVFLKNPNIAEQKVLIQEALGRKLQFRSRAFPDVTLGAMAGQQGERSTVPVTPAQNFALLTGNLKQPLFEASIPAAFRRGSVGVVVAQQNFQAEAVRILHQARIAYYDALLARSTLALYIELQAPLDANIKDEKDRITAGLSARSALITAEIRKLQIIPGREKARGSYLESLALIAQAMGSNLKEPASVQIFPKGPLVYMPVSFDLRAATEEALKNRPDVQLLRALIQQAEEDKRIARAGYYPRIDLKVDAQYLPNSILADSNAVNAIQDKRTTEAFMGPAYTWTVIDNGKVGGSSLRLQKIKEAYETKLSALEQDIPRNLSEIYRALDLSQKRISALAASVKRAEGNLKMVQDMITLGRANQLDFVNARNALFQTKQGMLTAFYQNSIALANLDLATGRYLRYVDSEPGKK